MAFKCGKCDTEFNSEDALAQHIRSKHGASQMVKWGVYGIVGLLTIIAIGYFALTAGDDEQRTDGNVPSDNFVLTANGMEGPGAMHIHPHLEIIINGQQQIIPANTGITATRMLTIHTHDASGTLHVESPVYKDFKLRHFFLIWGQQSKGKGIFNSTCIFDYCNDGNKTVKMFLNGEQNFEYENLTLGDLDRIKIMYD